MREKFEVHFVKREASKYEPVIIEVIRGFECLEDAEDKAIAIGVNKPTFARVHHYIEIDYSSM